MHRSTRRDLQCSIRASVRLLWPAHHQARQTIPVATGHRARDSPPALSVARPSRKNADSGSHPSLAARHCNAVFFYITRANTSMWSSAHPRPSPPPPPRFHDCSGKRRALSHECPPSENFGVKVFSKTKFVLLRHHALEKWSCRNVGEREVLSPQVRALYRPFYL